MKGLLAATCVCVVLVGIAAEAKVENVALRGRATMSSILTNGNGYLTHAINAIDGNLDPQIEHGSCAHTSNDMSPWWRVDLLTPHKILYLTITNTIQLPQRMNGAELLIGNSLANNGNDNPRMKGLLAAAAVCVVLCGIAAGAKVENVALQGRATMSSILTNGNGYLGHAINAIDGNLNSNVYQGSCAHTDKEANPWWRVDLLTPHKIQYVTITNTVTAPERMNGAELLIGNSLANNGNGNPRCTVIASIAAGATQTFQCDGMVGRYVNIILRGKNEYLHPCEVEVYGYPEEQACTCA